MGDQLLSIERPSVACLPQLAHERDRVRSIPALASRKTANAIRGSRRLRTEDQLTVADEHVEAVARFDPERSPGRTGHGDLVLTADLDA